MNIKNFSYRWGRAISQNTYEFRLMDLLIPMGGWLIPHVRDMGILLGCVEMIYLLLSRVVAMYTILSFQLEVYL